jgi:flagellin-like hook-associated protein FlgL
MPSILSTNMASLYAQRSLASAQADVATSVQRLSSGKRINSAKDDAAGLGISEGIAGIRNISNQSIRNLQNASSLVQTAEGALDVVNKILQRALTLTTQKNDATLNADQQGMIDGEINSLLSEIGRIRERTRFNSSETIFGAPYSFGSGPGVTTSFTIPDLSIPALELDGQTTTASVDSVLLALVANGNITIPNSVQFSGIARDIAKLGSVNLPNPVEVLGVTLDRSAVSTVAEGYSTSIINFSKSGSAVSGNKFDIQGHGFTDGDEVIYRKGSGSEIEPLVNGQRYFVKNVDSDTFQLSGTSGPSGVVINFNTLGSSTNADFLKVAASQVDISSVGINATTTTTLQISQNWFDGDKVFFAIGAATAGSTGGLRDGRVYTVSNQTANSVTLLDYSGQPVAFSFTDNLQGSTLQYLGGPRVTVANIEVRSPYHGFAGSGGEKIFYSGPNQGGLVQNTVYYASTLNPDTRSLTDQRDYFSLAPTPADAVARTNLISIPPAGQNNNFYWAPPNATPEGSFQSNPVLPANSLVMNDTSFQLDDLVFYRQGAAAIGGLTAGNLYHVVTASNNTIQLSSSQRGNVIELGPYSSLTGASLQKVSSQLVFDSGTQNNVILGDTISSTGHGFVDNDIIYYHEDVSPIGGLMENTPYHVINATLDTFQLSVSMSSPVIRFSGLGGNNQVFTPNTDRLTTLSAVSFNEGDRVYYSSTGDSIPELTIGEMYYVRSPIGNTFALSEEATGPIKSFTGSGSGDQTFSRLSDIIESDGHGFQNGQRVYYNSTGDSIPELTNGLSYFVRNRTENAFQLSANNDENAPIISFSDLGSGVQTFALDTDYIDASGNTFFSNGDIVVYNTNGGSQIDPLTAGSRYIVRDVSGSAFKLAEVGGSIIDISSIGTTPVSFTSVPSSDSIASTGHGFTNGQQVTYSSAGDSIPELTNGLSYFVRNRTDDAFQLSSTASGPIISFTGIGDIEQTFTLNTDYIVGTGAPPFSNDDIVIYNSDGGSSITNLVDDTRYVVRDVSGNGFKLSALNSEIIINISSTGTDPASFTSVPSSNTINSTGHGFANGQRVTYSPNDDAILGLIEGDSYYVRNSTSNTFELSETENGPIISFTENESDIQTFILNTDIINSEDHGFSTGDEVVYSADGGTIIGGLSEGGRYFVIRNDDDSFELSATNGGPVINLTSTGNGVFTHQSAAISTSSISNAITINSSNRAELGALSNSIGYAIDNLQTLSSNLSDAYSRIVDTDYASETANLTRSKILQEASAAMLAQANQMPNVILSLLK